MVEDRGWSSNPDGAPVATATDRNWTAIGEWVDAWVGYWMSPGKDLQEWDVRPWICAVDENCLLD